MDDYFRNSIYVNLPLMPRHQDIQENSSFMAPCNTLRQILYHNMMKQLVNYKKSIEEVNIAYNELIKAKALYTSHSGNKYNEQTRYVDLSVFKQQYYKAKDNWIDKANWCKVYKYEYKVAQSVFENAKKIFGESFYMNLASNKYGLKYRNKK